LSLDNYSTLLSELESTRQNEISFYTEASALRIAQLEKEKDYFIEISEYIEDLTLRLTGGKAPSSAYFYDELSKAQSALSSGADLDIGKLTSSASTYLDSALQGATSQRDYFMEVVKVRNELSDFGSDIANGGSLSSIEGAILAEKSALELQLQALNNTTLSILEVWKTSAVTGINKAQSATTAIQNDTITKAYTDILGRTADTGGYDYWSSQVVGGAISGTDITKAIGIASIPELYQTLLGRAPDAGGLAYWTNEINNGNINPSEIDDAIKNAAKAELSVRKFADGGIITKPTYGLIGEAGYSEAVIPLKNPNDPLGMEAVVNELQALRKDNADMRQLMIKLVADNTKQLTTQRAILGAQGVA